MAGNGQVKGLDVCLRNLKKIHTSMEKNMGGALNEWGKGTMTESKDDFCPVDTGEMKGTGDSTLEKDGDRIWVILYYNTDYAPTVHEGTAYHPIGESGFLIKPFNKNTPKLVKYLTTGMKEAIK